MLIEHGHGHKCPMIAHYCVSTAIHDPGLHAWRQQRFLEPDLQRFKSISSTILDVKCPVLNSEYSAQTLTPWQLVMDDHDQWNPDLDESKTKITSLKVY